MYCIIMHHWCLLITQTVTQYRHSYIRVNSLWLWQKSTQAKGLSTQNTFENPGCIFFLPLRQIVAWNITINFLQKWYHLNCILPYTVQDSARYSDNNELDSKCLLVQMRHYSTSNNCKGNPHKFSKWNQN